MLFLFFCLIFCEDEEDFFLDSFEDGYENLPYCEPADLSQYEEVDIVVIGSGPAGNTAALYAAKAGYKTYVYTGSTPGGQLTTTGTVENFPAFKGKGTELVETIRQQAEDFGAVYKYDKITSVDFDSYPKLITSLNGDHIAARAVIIATGATPRLLGLESEQRLFGRGVSTCAHCDGSLYRGNSIVIVGGGNTASEEALYLKKICPNVTIITRGDSLRSSKAHQRQIDANGIRVITNAQVYNITGFTHVSGVKYTDMTTNKNHTICCRAVFIAIGLDPETSLFKGSLKMTRDGRIVTDAETRTNIDGVFAAGDCTDGRFKQAVVASADGCKAAMLAIEYILQLEKQ